MLAREPGKAQGGRDRLLEAKKSQRDVEQQERLSACSLAGFLRSERPSIPLRMCWRLRSSAACTPARRAVRAPFKVVSLLVKT